MYKVHYKTKVLYPECYSHCSKIHLNEPFYMIHLLGINHCLAALKCNLNCLNFTECVSVCDTYVKTTLRISSEFLHVKDLHIFLY